MFVHSTRSVFQKASTIFWNDPGEEFVTYTIQKGGKKGGITNLKAAKLSQEDDFIFFPNSIPNVDVFTESGTRHKNVCNHY